MGEPAWLRAVSFTLWSLDNSITDHKQTAHKMLLGCISFPTTSEVWVLGLSSLLNHLNRDQDKSISYTNIQLC